MSRAIIFLIILICWQQAVSQNAPLTTIGTFTAAIPGAIQVTVSVTEFNYIGAIYLSIDYDYTVMQLTGATPHAQLPTFLYGDADLGTGFHRITLGWYGNGLTLPDLSTIMTLHFNFNGGYSELVFYDSGPSCEYANGDGEVLNDIPFESFYFNGEVCGALTNPGSITGNASVCRQQGPVNYSVVPNASASAYIWSVPTGANILCGQNTNLIMVEFPENSQSGNVQVYETNLCNMMSPLSVMPVTVNNLPVANAGNDSSIPYGTYTTLNAASGGSGNYSYHWSPEELLVNPGVQNPQTVSLYSTTAYILFVTDLETGCQASDLKIVEISGGPLAINPIAMPDSICAGAESVIHAFASGGTGNYTYTWVSDPPGLNSGNESVSYSPETTTTCYLYVSDGFNSTSDSVVIFAEEAITATISGIDTLCGAGGTTILTVDLTGSPPWEFVYSFGSQSVLVEEQYTTPYNLVTGNAGTYTISYVQSTFCAGTGIGEGTVLRFPIPPAPVIQLFETTLVSSICCGNQWYRNDIAIPGATEVSYTAMESGKYYDIVTRFSCVSDTSNALDIVIIALDEIPAGTFDIYPNPSSGLARIGYTAIYPGEADISLFTLDGRQVKTMRYTLTAGANKINIDLTGVKSGLYILKMESGVEVMVRKIVIYKG